MTSLRNPKGGLINVALTDPSSLFVNQTYGYLSSKAHSSWTASTLLGEVEFHSDTSIHQICITPFTHGWFRFVAVLAQVFGRKTLFFPSFRGGISFGTGRMDSEGSKMRRKAKINSAPIDGPLLSSDHISK